MNAVALGGASGGAGIWRLEHIAGAAVDFKLTGGRVERQVEAKG